MNSLTPLLLSYFPLLALFILAGAVLLRLTMWKVEACKPEASGDIASDVALLWGVFGVILLHLTAVAYTWAPRLFPMGLLGLWELLFLSSWAGLMFGGLGNAYVRMALWRAGDEKQARPALFYGLLALTGLAGMGMAVSCRWTTSWLLSAWSSWFSSVLNIGVPGAEPGLLATLPLAAPSCLLLLLVCCVLWPASGLSLGEVFPLRSVLKRLQAGAAPGVEP